MSALTINKTQSWFGNVLRYGTDDNGVVWFVLNDVMAAMGITDPTMGPNLKKKFPEEIGKTKVLDSNGKRQKTNIVSEDVVYSRIVARSNKPAAIRFSRWVGEVIRTIRQTGEYKTNTFEMKTLENESLKLEMELVKFALQAFPDDERMKFLAHEKTSSLLSGQKLLTTDATPPRKVSEIMEDTYAPKVVLKNRSKVGRHVAKRFREYFKRDPDTTNVLVNGHSCKVKIYKSSEIEKVTEWINEILAP